MSGEDQALMAYIDGEVRAVCEANGWGHQIRRKWSVREKPVAESPIDDYEWKLIPDAEGKLPDDPKSNFYEGYYYVLCYDKPNDRFVLQHDTFHAGWGSREIATYTEIRLDPVAAMLIMRNEHKTTLDHPPTGWLRDHLLALTKQYRPNRFSRT